MWSYTKREYNVLEHILYELCEICRDHVHMLYACFTNRQKNILFYKIVSIIDV
jgi:hypothetical protein